MSFKYTSLTAIVILTTFFHLPRYPTAKDISECFKRVACDPLVKSSSSMANCEVDSLPDFIQVHEFIEHVRSN